MSCLTFQVLKTANHRSGHYRPPAANFRAFIHSLQDRGVDMSHVSISKSYAVLAGIEGYTRTKRKMRALHEKVDDTKHKILQGHHNEEKCVDPTHAKGKGGLEAESAGENKHETTGKEHSDLPFRTKSVN
jgi:hypothetical protein